MQKNAFLTVYALFLASLENRAGEIFLEAVSKVIELLIIKLF
jgi:hypothetical protein